MVLAALKVALLIGVLHGSITLAAAKCDGVCVKMDECENTFGGVNFVNLRFGDEDYEEADCPHYLEICCDLDQVVTTKAPLVVDAVVGGQSGEKGDHSGEDDDQRRSLNIGEVTSEIPRVSAVNEASKEKSSEEVKSDTIEPQAQSSVENAAVENPAIRTVDQVKQFGECGIRNPEGISFRLGNSKSNETEFGEFPWMVAVLQAHSEAESEVSTYACGGSLIAPNVILTVAHCVMDKQANELTVRAGEWDTMTTNEYIPHQERQVSSIIMHPNFNRNLLFHDLALLVVVSPFTADDNVQLACLPPQGMDFTSENCFAAGWGKTAFDAKSYHAILKRVPLPMVQRAHCQNALRTTKLGNRFRLHESFICAGGEEGVDTCTGDGGSPLVCPVEGTANKYYQAGIVAWGINCGQSNVPGVYVRASLYTNWIDAELLKLNFVAVDKRNSI
ncbi:tryptase [Aedes aegypti]|uniref:Phenoloxidase-activating factor 2 n=1 Tax=Aedes aegypti TaxID=7159 RepID=A0A1S4F2H3_AEDAE|nr:tryptase [Aedes aegypti]